MPCGVCYPALSSPQAPGVLYGAVVLALGEVEDGGVALWLGLLVGAVDVTGPGEDAGQLLDESAGEVRLEEESVGLKEELEGGVVAER